MAQRSLPWDGETTGDAGSYSDDNWQDTWARIFHAAAGNTGYANRGPLIDSGNAPNVGLQVQATGPASAAVDVLPGAAFVEGSYYESTATETIAVAANASGNPRIDTIILEKDDAAQTVRLDISQGTPAVTPTPPALTQTAGTLWQIPIADIAVANGFATIGNADITPRAEWANAADGVYLKDVLNNSGATLETGQVVVVDNSADRAASTTTQANHPYPLGVWVGRTNNGDYGRAISKGIGYVEVDGAYTAGQGLMTSTTAGQVTAISSTSRQTGNIGFLLEDSGGAGQLALALIDVRRNLIESALYTDQVAQNTAGPTFTTGADRTVALTTEESDTGGLGALAANQVTIQPGVYHVTGRLNIRGNNPNGTGARLKIYDTTAAADVAVGVNEFVNSNEYQHLEVSAELEFTVASALELRVRITTGNSQAGFALNIAGETEHYAELEFVRLN